MTYANHPYFNHITKPNSFKEVRRALTNRFLASSHQVHADKWQGVDISNKPDMVSYELLNVTFTQELYQIEDLDYWREDIEPNLPWADNHFEERVCGQPINPGVEWANWPWGGNADGFREPSVRVMGRDDWAYLAGIIDGEGSLSIRTANGDRAYPRIKITQVDEGFLRQLYDKWGVGTFREYSGESNELSSRQSYIWRISSKSEVRWILDGCLPYLRLKRDRALKCLSHIDPKETVYDEEPRFNHNYMMRYWPRYAGRDEERANFGIYNEYGDLDDLVSQLVADPLSRQEWFPIFYPEDVGSVVGGRKPCSLGYQFIVRDSCLHVYYPLRSCDFHRHMQDDIYLTVRLLLWVLEECRKRPEATQRSWEYIKPGSFTMHCTSLHLFENDMLQMKKKGYV